MKNKSCYPCPKDWHRHLTCDIWPAIHTSEFTRESKSCSAWLMRMTWLTWLIWTLQRLNLWFPAFNYLLFLLWLWQLLVFIQEFFIRQGNPNTNHHKKRQRKLTTIVPVDKSGFRKKPGSTETAGRAQHGPSPAPHPRSQVSSSCLNTRGDP